jgi:hypothetical protein
LPDLDLHVGLPLSQDERHAAAGNLPRDRQRNGMTD